MATGFLAAGVGFFTTGFFATAFLAAGVGFFTTGFLATGFLAAGVGFFTTGFLAGAFLPDVALVEIAFFAGTLSLGVGAGQCTGRGGPSTPGTADGEIADTGSHLAIVPTWLRRSRYLRI